MRVHRWIRRDARSDGVNGRAPPEPSARDGGAIAVAPSAGLVATTIARGPLGFGEPT
jgi:hypothetical protein